MEDATGLDEPKPEPHPNCIWISVTACSDQKRVTALYILGWAFPASFRSLEGHPSVSVCIDQFHCL